jgi:hypothetical protein
MGAEESEVVGAMCCMCSVRVTRILGFAQEYTTSPRNSSTDGVQAE